MSDEGEPLLGWTEALGEHASNPAEPRTSGETLFALGREWKVSSFENRLKAQFEQWMRRQAKKSIQDAEIEEGPEEAAKMRSAYIADMAAGHYTWDGRHGRSARGDLPGLHQILFLALRRCHPEVTLEQVEAMFREDARNCGLALRWSLGNSAASAVTMPTEATLNETMTTQQKRQQLLEQLEKLERMTPTRSTLDSPY